MRFTLIALAACAVACLLSPCSAQKTPTSSSPPQSSPPLSSSPSSLSTPARQSAGADPMSSEARADLTIREYEFSPTDERALRVNVANLGAAEAGASVLRMKVHKIKGNSVGRVLEIEVPAIPANGNVWVSLQTDNIIPRDVRLKDTSFRLNLDVRNAVKEANEENNETWHNQNQPGKETADDG